LREQLSIKKRVIPGITIVVLIFLFGCSSKNEKILIGVAGPLTGDQSKMGHDVKNGVQLAVTEWNQRGGVLGKPIHIIDMDDQHDPIQAVSVANKIVNSGVVGVIGHFNSSASISASSVYHAARVPMITPASVNSVLTEQGFPEVFRICGRDDQQAKVAAEFITRKLKPKRLAILHDKTTYGKGLASNLKTILEIENQTNLVFYNGITQGEKDFYALLTKMIGEMRPDLICFGGMYTEGGLLVKQARTLGFRGVFLGGDGMIDSKFVEIAGSAAEGTFLTFSRDPADSLPGKRFYEKYKSHFGVTQPAPYAVYAYDAANILLTAIQKAGTVEKESLIQALRGLSYQGVIGSVEFDSKGDIKQAPYIVWVTKNGGFEEYWFPS
jgi:branched-chain amino acid transport system substrate-binding protein